MSKLRDEVVVALELWECTGTTLIDANGFPMADMNSKVVSWITACEKAGLSEKAVEIANDIRQELFHEQVELLRQLDEEQQ